MEKKFTIAEANRSSSFTFVGKKTKVPEGIFWNILEAKITQISLSKPERVTEGLQISTEAIKSQKGGVTVGDICFEIIGK